MNFKEITGCMLILSLFVALFYYAVSMVGYQIAIETAVVASVTTIVITISVYLISKD